MIDHSRCAHEHTKSARARCRRTHARKTDDAEQSTHVPERAESVSNSPLALARLLTRDSVRPSLWIALRRGDDVQTGYIIACDPVLMLSLSGDGIVSLSWDDSWQLYDETP